MDSILRKHVDILGMKVKDKVTGYAGVVSCVTFDLYGCVQVIVTPYADDKGELKDGKWLDIQRLEITSSARVMPIPAFDNFATPEGVHMHGPAEKPIR